MHFVYIIRNSANKLYVGVTKNPKARLQSYNERRGAQFTKRIPTFEIVFLEQCEILPEARKREIQEMAARQERNVD
jgi:predicted GIY-YIG superfamily endonuclease